MPHRFSTALSHIALAGTGIYCLAKTSDFAVHFPRLTFGIITINSMLGVWRWGNPEYGDDVDIFYKLTTYVQLMLALPCLTIAECLQLGYNPYASWALIAIPGLMCIYWILCSDDISEKYDDLVVPIEVAVLGVVSFLGEKYWGIAAAASFVINYYLVWKQRDSESIPAQDLYNYGLCFFTYFALMTYLE